MAIWVPSVTNESKETEVSDSKNLKRGYSVLSPLEEKNEEGIWRQTGEGKEMELSVVGNPSSHAGMDDETFLEDLKVCLSLFSYLKLNLRRTRSCKFSIVVLSVLLEAKLLNCLHYMC